MFDSREFRRALGCFVTGVAVVITRDHDGSPRGFTANSFSSVSLDPPLVSICIDHGISSYQVFSRCSRFTVNILGEHQKEVSSVFASKAADKFSRVPTISGGNGTLQLEHCVAGFECVPYKKVEAGDHLILIGEVKDFHYTDMSPLSFCRGNYITFDLMQQIITQQPGHELRLGCILGDGERVFLIREPDSDRWTFPVSDSMGSAGGTRGLHGVLKKFGINADLNFLFSVFDGPGVDQLSIFYRGEVSAADMDPAAAAGFFAYDAIPWDRLPHPSYATMLRRYVDERRRFRFGVYVGTAERGAVVEL